MAVDERSRHALQGRLEQVLGADHAETLMSHLREIGTGKLVTRTYLDERLQLSEERILRTIREELHAELQVVRSEFREEISGLRSEVHGDIRGLYGEFHRQTRVLLFSLLGANATFAGLVFAAARSV
ncbi:MAG: CCDC90 family protein [Actinobacteria bacterium]|nr:CCDC90 family protein [Actinomycetota bacterium]